MFLLSIFITLLMLFESKCVSTSSEKSSEESSEENTSMSELEITEANITISEEMFAPHSSIEIHNESYDDVKESGKPPTPCNSFLTKPQMKHSPCKNIFDSSEEIKISHISEIPTPPNLGPNNNKCPGVKGILINCSSGLNTINGAPGPLGTPSPHWPKDLRPSIAESSKLDLPNQGQHFPWNHVNDVTMIERDHPLNDERLLDTNNALIKNTITLPASDVTEPAVSSQHNFQLTWDKRPILKIPIPKFLSPIKNLYPNKQPLIFNFFSKFKNPLHKILPVTNYPKRLPTPINSTPVLSRVPVQSPFLIQQLPLSPLKPYEIKPVPSYPNRPLMPPTFTPVLSKFQIVPPYLYPQRPYSSLHASTLIPTKGVYLGHNFIGAFKPFGIPNLNYHIPPSMNTNQLGFLPPKFIVPPIFIKRPQSFVIPATYVPNRILSPIPSISFKTPPVLVHPNANFFQIPHANRPIGFLAPQSTAYWTPNRQILNQPRFVHYVPRRFILPRTISLVPSLMLPPLNGPNNLLPQIPLIPRPQPFLYGNNRQPPCNRFASIPNKNCLSSLSSPIAGSVYNPILFGQTNLIIKPALVSSSKL